MAGMKDFWANLGRINDVGRANRFQVMIPTPRALKNKTLYDSIFTAEVAELPGIQLNTLDRKDYGITQKMPTSVMYGETSITFYCWGNRTSSSMDTGLPQKRFFDDWFQAISPAPIDGNDGNAAYNLNYKNEYTTTISIQHLDSTNKGGRYSTEETLSYETVLVDAFPISMGAISLSWSDDSIIRLPITFAYTRWYRGGPSQKAAAGTKSSDIQIQALPPSPGFGGPGYNPDVRTGTVPGRTIDSPIIDNFDNS